MAPTRQPDRQSPWDIKKSFSFTNIIFGNLGISDLLQSYSNNISLGFTIEEKSGAKGGGSEFWGDLMSLTPKCEFFLENL